MTSRSIQRILTALAVCVLPSLVGCDDILFGESKPCDPSLPDDEYDSCPDPSKDEGENGGECRDGFYLGNPCNDGRCWRDKCWECGGAEQICCSFGGCDVGTCADRVGSKPDPDVCRTDCGGAGQPCCPIDDGKGDKCGGSMKCVEGTCQEPVEPGCGGSDLFYVMLVHPVTQCLGGVVPTTADSAEAAQSCIQAENPNLVVSDVLSSQPEIEQYYFCANGMVPGLPDSQVGPYDHYSEELAEQCMQAERCTSGLCGYGACP